MAEITSREIKDKIGNGIGFENKLEEGGEVNCNYNNDTLIDEQRVF